MATSESAAKAGTGFQSDWPPWDYAVSYASTRVDFSVRWPQRPLLGEVGRFEGPIWYGRLLLLFGKKSQLPEASVSMLFLERTAEFSLASPTREQLAEELNDAAKRVSAARGETPLGRFSEGDFQIEQIDDRRWYVFSAGPCNRRYFTVAGQESIIQLLINCRGGKWSGLQSRERLWQPWIRSILSSVRVAAAGSARGGVASFGQAL